MRIFLITLLTTLLSLQANAQLSTGGVPSSFALSISQNVQEVEMPQIPIIQIIQEDAIFDTMDVPWRFAYPMKVNFNLNNSGVWHNLADGSRIWRLKVTCKGALSVNFLYDSFFMPEGASLYLYQEDKSQVLGAFTSINNKSHGRFATALINNESVILEYYEPRDQYGKGIISIAQVAHGYRSVDEQPGRGLGDSGSCQVNINCIPEGDNWQDEKKSVGKIVVNGSGLCTGSLINNTNEDCTPYFLTAHHCIGSLDAVTNPDAGNWVFYWNYERSSCDNTGAVPDETTSGAVLVANDSPSDFALFELDENPADSYDVYFNGYNATNTTGQGGVGIHHPSGDAKKIATHDLTPTNAGWGGSGPAGSHWRVSPWSATTNGHSVTEGGSSGSPLFDANSRVIGQLHGGSSINCSDPPNDPGIYGKVSWSWENSGATDSRRRLHDWLDPVGGGTNTTLDGSYGSCSEPIVRFLAAGSLMLEEEADIDNGCLDYKEYSVGVKITREPTADAFVSLNISGTATEGLNEDFEISPAIIILNATNLESEFIVKVYNDAYVESNEDILLELVLDANGGDAILSPTLYEHTAIIKDNDPSLGPVFDYTFYTNNFNSGFDGFTSTNPGGGDLWALGTFSDASSSYFNVPDNGGDQLTFVNDDACDCDMNNVSLISSSQDFTGFDSVFYEFQVFFLGNTYQGNTETAKVQISLNGGAFVDLPGGEITGASGWRLLSFDLTAYINQTNVRVALHYSDGSGWLYGMAVDNARFRGIAPTQVQIEDNFAFLDEEYLGPYQTVHFFSTDFSRIMASIENLGPHDFGCTQVYIDRGGDDMSTTYPFANTNPANHPLNKTFRIIPEFNNTSSSYQISLFYTDEEISHWVAQTGGTLNDLMLIKVDGESVANINPTNFGNYNVTTAFATHSNLNTHHKLSAEFHTGFSGFVAGPEPTPLLPVELLSFNAFFKTEKMIEISWDVAQEIEIAHYELERSSDGIHFQSIYSVMANEQSKYAYLDEEFATGAIYYRLRIHEEDERTWYSDIKTLLTNQTKNISIYPNPSQNSFFLNSNADIKEIAMYDQKGKLIRNLNQANISNKHLVELKRENLSPGLYFILVETTKGLHREKLILH